MIKLSKPGKMPCKSWSLQAIDTCPGSVDKSHPSGLVPACRGCYATDGNYRFDNVKAPRLHNAQDWKRKAWVDDMVAAIGSQEYFRWFDSGDMYSVGLANKILSVVMATPNTKHWIPTRVFKFKKFELALRMLQRQPNCVVRRSSDGIHGETVPTGLHAPHSSTIFDPMDPPLSLLAANVCPAYSQDGKCGDCRACWNRELKVIAYPQHGRKMARVNRDLIAAVAA